jgi:hypothetical protein
VKNLVSKFVFKWINLYRYDWAKLMDKLGVKGARRRATPGHEVGLLQVGLSLPMACKRLGVSNLETIK